MIEETVGAVATTENTAEETSTDNTSGGDVAIANGGSIEQNDGSEGSAGGTLELTFAQRFLTLPREELEKQLSEYEERRNVFREWLLRKFVPGVHYGTPPGTARFNANGDLLDFKGNVVDKDAWQHKPSLYKAGALMLKDVLQLREVFEPDRDTWEQQGGDSGTFVIKCTLFDRLTGRPVSEGRGSYSVGGRIKANANTAIKMAEKSALVDAVLNAAAVADLFTQDMGNENDGRKAPDAEQEHDLPGPDVLWPEIVRRSKAAWGSSGWERGIVAFCADKLQLVDVDRNDPKVLMTILKALNSDDSVTKPQTTTSESFVDTIRDAAIGVYGDDHWEDGLAGILSTDEYGGKALEELTTAQAARLLAGLRASGGAA